MMTLSCSSILLIVADDVELTNMVRFKSSDFDQNFVELIVAELLGFCSKVVGKILKRGFGANRICLSLYSA